MLKGLEDTKCPVRTDWGCQCCGFLDKPNCYGAHILAHEAEIRVLKQQAADQKEAVDTAAKSVKAAKKRIYDLSKRAEKLAVELENARGHLQHEREIWAEYGVQVARHQKKIAQIEAGDGFTRHVKQTTIRRNRLYNVEVKPTTNEGQTLCSKCSVCTCEWMGKKPSPVPGWDAVQSKIYDDGYVVLQCPKFVAMPPRSTTHLELTQEEFNAPNGRKPHDACLYARKEEQQ